MAPRLRGQFEDVPFHDLLGEPGERPDAEAHAADLLPVRRQGGGIEEPADDTGLMHRRVPLPPWRLLPRRPG